MLRRMRNSLSVMAAVLCLGLGAPALASDGFERDPFIDREDLLEELILQQGLVGRPFVSPFLVNPFGVNQFVVNPFGVSPFLVNPFGVSPFLVDPFDFEEELFDVEAFGEERFEFGEDDD